jgi:hypothetical protein
MSKTLHYAQPHFSPRRVVVATWLLAVGRIPQWLGIECKLQTASSPYKSQAEAGPL